MNKATLKDQADRDKISNSLDQTFLVEAGAGSGKTAGLVKRMVALLAEGRCEPQKMAAVTFTRKAAGELKERFQVGIEERRRQESDRQVRVRLTEALEKIERIFTGTIHAFCARLLRERPIEAGIAPDFTEIEGLEEKMLEETAWEQYLVEVGANNPQLLDRLDELDLSHRDLQKAFQELNLYPDVEIVKQQTNKPDFNAARKELDLFLQKVGPMLRPDMPDKGWDGLQSKIRAALRWKTLFNLQDDRFFVRLLGRLDGSCELTLIRWHQDKAEVKALKEQFAAYQEDFIKPALDAWLAYRHYHLLEFIEPAVKHYREMRIRENLLNYQDLLMLTAKLLRDNSEVRSYFQQAYTHLLVDEFQDTDPIQAEIMFYLTGKKVDEKDWTKLTPRPGSLFVVGDPKQSIYRFRRADIATYDQVKQLIKGSGGEILNLSTNFRSLPGLIDWGNTAFEKLFSPIKPPYQAQFTAMDSIQVNQGGCTEGLLSLPVDNIKWDKQEKIAATDAEKVADWIEQAISGGIRLSRSEEEIKRGLGETAKASDFLVIVKNKLNMTLYARALEKRGIAFSLSGGGGLAESAELKELLNLLKALADPENPVPLVATLRGIFFGFSDDLLYRFKQAGGQFNLLVPVPDKADQDLQDRFSSAFHAMRCYRVWTKKLPPSSAIEKIADGLGLISYALAGEMGRGRAGSIVQALELLRSLESRGKISFGGAVDFLERLLEEGVEEELSIDGGSTPAVRIINLHKAKGLEAPVVILANPGNHKVFDPSLHVARTAGFVEGYLVIEKIINDYGKVETLALPPKWDSKKEEEEKYRDAEYIRLLYVAATRAKNILVISTYQGKPEKSPWHPLEEFLNEQNCREAFSALQPPLKTTAQQLVAEPGPGSEPETGLEPGSEPEPGPEPEPEPGSAPEPESETETGSAPEPEPGPISVDMMQAAASSVSNGLKSISETTYRHISGTALHSGEELPERQTRGRGTAWGTAVHIALDYLVSENIINPAGSGRTGVRAEDLQQAAETAALEAELSESQKDELQQTLKDLVASAFWQRISAAADLMSEIPFGSWEANTYSTGIVDLAFRDNSGWVLVDYKSDAIENHAHRQALVEHYRPQLEFYRKSWEEITGEKVTECALFFTDKLFYAVL